MKVVCIFSTIVPIRPGIGQDLEVLAGQMLGGRLEHLGNAKAVGMFSTKADDQWTINVDTQVNLDMDIQAPNKYAAETMASEKLSKELESLGIKTESITTIAFDEADAVAL